jgi:naphtho-gamma-pyrone polyketide synthase
VTINAPYHAEHLYDESDIDAILEKCSSQNLGHCEPGIPIISSTTGDLISSSDYASLFRSTLAEILLQPIRWDRVIRSCASVVKSSGVSHCDIFSIASSTSQSLLSALREVGNIGVDLKNDIMDGIKSGTSTGRQEQSKIAITGLSGRFPEAANPDQFWDLLHRGLDVHREVPLDRFDIKSHYDPTGKRKNTSQTPYGCFINEPGLFDARFFNMSPKEAAQSDPGQRLALLTACEALEMAGFVPNRTPSTQKDRVGIFYGMTSDDWREVNSGQNVGTYFIPGGNRAFTPGRINYHFKFSGPSVSVDTACSSSLAAIHIACNSLWRNDCDTAIAGGTNVMTNPDNFAGLDKGHFLSRTGNCKTFDDSADGYCRADAVGTVVLKRLEDALADGDPIQAIIAGAYTNHSAESDS